MALDEQGPARPDGSMNIAVIDSETTGLDPETDEVIGLGLLLVHVDRQRGQVLGVVGSAFEWQEPKGYSEAAQAVIRIPKRQLEDGCRFNRGKVEDLLAQTDLVVAHNAVFERAFLLPLLPELGKLRWACSLADIDWREGQNVLYPIHRWAAEVLPHRPDQQDAGGRLPCPRANPVAAAAGVDGDGLPSADRRVGAGHGGVRGA